MPSIEVSVICPAYNEEDTIEIAVRAILETLRSFMANRTFEVIIAEDGCDDQTPVIAARLSAQNPHVRHIHSDKRLGRGKSLAGALNESYGDILLYVDTDMATDVSHIRDLVEFVRGDGYDIATGSRYLPESKAKRPVRRLLPSICYNTLVRLLLKSKIKDHQCGFKSFKRKVIYDILPNVQDDHWFWDTEVLVKAQRSGYQVKEFPVNWTAKSNSKVDVFQDAYSMGTQIVRMWRE